MSAEIDFYELLEVERTADDKIIKSSYRRLAMKFHPDKNPGDAEAEANEVAIKVPEFDARCRSVPRCVVTPPAATDQPFCAGIWTFGMKRNR